MTDTPMYSRAARLRLALAEVAAEISDQARALVPTGADEAGRAGEWAEQANYVLTAARELLTLAVAYERQRGTSWIEIGERLGIAKQGAHERYANQVKQLGDDMVISWALGGPRSYVGLREGITDPDSAAARLDRWARVRDDHDADRPVSGHLPTMTIAEHVNMTLAVADLLAAMRNGKRGHVAGLELGHARRKVELYERMLAEETAQPGSTGTSLDELQDLLAGARARLADIQAAETEA